MKENMSGVVSNMSSFYTCYISYCRLSLVEIKLFSSKLTLLICGMFEKNVHEIIQMITTLLCV